MSDHLKEIILDGNGCNGSSIRRPQSKSTPEEENHHAFYLPQVLYLPRPNTKEKKSEFANNIRA